MDYDKKRINKDITRITFPDERWYFNKEKDCYMPSVTWICNYYPKDKFFMQWLAGNGWDDAEIIKQEAGNRGTRVHKAIEYLLEEGSISMSKKFPNEQGESTSLTPDEYECVMSFSRWYEEFKPEIISVEESVFQYPNKTFTEGFAGTVDILCKIDGKMWLVDIKTSKNIYMSHKLQISAYKYALGKKLNLAILQVGYLRNKKRFKFTEIPDVIKLFRSVYSIWDYEIKYKKPSQKDYPNKINIKS